MSSLDNGIWLCVRCADEVDLNTGKDVSAETLIEWKSTRESDAAREFGTSEFVEIGGTIVASGVGEVTGLEVTKDNVRVQPGLVVEASGIGRVTGVKV